LSMPVDIYAAEEKTFAGAGSEGAEPPAV
jgi:hypothetical protein